MIFMDIKTALQIVLAMAKRAKPNEHPVGKAGEKQAVKVVEAYRKSIKE